MARRRWIVVGLAGLTGCKAFMCLCSGCISNQVVFSRFIIKEPMDAHTKDFTVRLFFTLLHTLLLILLLRHSFTNDLNAEHQHQMIQMIQMLLIIGHSSPFQ